MHPAAGPASMIAVPEATERVPESPMDYCSNHPVPLAVPEVRGT